MGLFIETLLRRLAEMIVALAFSQLKKAPARRWINKLTSEIFHRLAIVGVEVKVCGR